MLVQEKLRRQDYGDVLLAYGKGNGPAWVEKPSAADWFAYGVLPAGRCWLLPWRSLQRAWRQHGRAWQEQYGVGEARDLGYAARFVSVPPRVLFEAAATIHVEPEPEPVEDLEAQIRRLL